MNFDSGSVFHSLIHPGHNVHFNDKSEKIHGISREMVMNENTLPWSAVCDAFMRWIQKEADGKRVMLMAHNGFSFDFPIFLHKASGRPIRDWLFFDTLRYVQQLKREGLSVQSLKLEDLRKQLSIEVSGVAHHADADVLDMGRVFKKLLEWQGHEALGRLEQSILNGTCGSCRSYTSLADPISEAAENRDAEPETAPRKRSVVSVNSDITQQVKDVLKQPYDGRLSMFLCKDLGSAKFYTPSVVQRLKDCGYTTLMQVLKHLPKEYTPLVELDNAEALAEGSVVMIKGTVADHSVVKGPSYVGWRVDIASGSWRVVCSEFVGRSVKSLYGANHRSKRYPIGTEVLVVGTVQSGSVEGKRCKINLNQIEKVSDVGDISVMPIYKGKKRIKPQMFQDIISKAIEALEPFATLDVYPAELKQRHQLGSWLQALFTLHRPQSEEALTEAIYTVKLHDMLCLHALLFCKTREKIEKSIEQAFSIQNSDMVGICKQAFQYELTEDQDRCLEEILKDLRGETPMLRILQGDVGTGKTIVAMAAMFATYGAGYQSALVVPTEILGRQHFRTLHKLVQNCPNRSQPTISILTAATKRSERIKILNQLADGEIDMLIGTHSLFNKSVQFDKLGFVIVDEQHKFGVEQRQKIQQTNGITPHLLMMSATPIPRSLALVIHGTVSVSAIDTPLPGKKEVETIIVKQSEPGEMHQMFTRAREDLAQGGRVYIVFPCISRSEADSFTHLKSVKEEYEVLKETVFQDFSCGLVHGRMSAEEKSDAFARFANGETHVLMATTVIEVGMDVHEASVMIVYHPERFGLAQLHQLRGRVGRGERPSVCYLVPPESVERIEILAASSDGAAIALEDLGNRGPGDFFGADQSGFKNFTTFPFASMISDAFLVTTSRDAAEHFLDLTDGTLPPEFSEMLKIQGFPELDDFDI